jgi:hypothetical protein
MHISFSKLDVHAYLTQVKSPGVTNPPHFVTPLERHYTPVVSLSNHDWWWNDGATILTSLLSPFTLAAAGVWTVVRYFNDRRDAREKQEAETKRLAEDRQAEREKRAEEHFQAAVEGLSSEREEAKVGAAIPLSRFLGLGYEQFSTQTFDSAVAHLRLPRTSQPPTDPTDPLPLPPLSQALMMVFQGFPILTKWRKEVKEKGGGSLSSTRVKKESFPCRIQKNTNRGKLCME